MATEDTLQRFIFDNAPIRGEFIHLEESYQTIMQQHRYPPAIRKVLGEALCVAGLLSAIIKFDGRLTVQFRGKGRLKLLLAQCDNHFNIRGLAKWDEELSYEELMDAFKEGVLVITLDAGVHKGQPYQGIVEWKNNLVESIEGYFKQSEQLATKFWLAANETTAAGFLLQAVPTSDRNAIGIHKEIIQPSFDRFVKVAADLQPEDLLYEDYRLMLRRLYPDEEIRIFRSEEIKFNCTCSVKRSENAIEILGREEAEAELKDKQTIVVTCDFCNKEYVFDRIDVARIFEKGEPPSNKHLH